VEDNEPRNRYHQFAQLVYLGTCIPVGRTWWFQISFCGASQLHNDCIFWDEIVVMNVIPLQNFIKRVRGAAAGRSKDVRLTIEEAQELVGSLGELLAAHVDEIQKAPVDQSITINLDGGKF
jgi:hypothetical protein